MAPPRRTFFIMLITITGILYFLYTIYTSTLDGPTYRFGSWSKVLKNFSYSSSPLIQKEEERYNNLSELTGSITNMTSSVNNNNSNNNNNNNNNTNYESAGSAGPSKSRNDPVAPASLSSNKTEEKKSERVSPVPVRPKALPGGAKESDKKKKKKEEEEEEQVEEPKGKIIKKESDNMKPKESFIQKIPGKTENSTIDNIVEGVMTRTVYDSGFTLPNLELCPDFGSKLQVVIIVTSAPKHAEARSAIRQTWGHYQLRKDVAIAFIVGRSPDVKESVIREENDLYGDLIFANFVDSYNNLTLKTVSILEWVDNYCGQAKFVLKTDDDMFINIPKLLQFIGNHLKDKRKIFGKLAKKWKPIRKKASKYYVSVKQYKNSLFPDFTTGPAYLMTSDVIHDLYVTALEKTYLKLEDVYTTGIVAQEERIQRVHVNEFFNRRITLSPCNVQKGISIHMIKPFEQYDLWKKLLDGRSKC